MLFRSHASQARVLKILARLNRWYLDEQPKNEIVADLDVTKEDFESNTDIIPVSDPHIFSETQRYAQIQTLAARAQANPDLYNRLAVEKRILKQIKLPDVNEVLPDPQDVKDMNPALENVSMALGKPAGAYPSQDHIAHILAHLGYGLDPLLGANPVIAPVFIPQCLEHVKQHLNLWYLNQVDTYASTALKRPIDLMKVQPIPAEAQKLIAASTQHVHQDSQEQFGGVMQVIMQMLQKLQQMKQSQPVQDPAIQALIQTQMAETQRKAQKDQADAQLDAQALQAKTAYEMQKLQNEVVQNTEDNLTQERIKAAEVTRDAAQLQHEQLQTVLEAQNQAQANIGGQPNV